MGRQEFHDDIISEIVKKNCHKLSSVDFENKVMSKIHHELELKNQVSNKLKLSMVFFTIGTILGIRATLLFMNSFDVIVGFNPKDVGFIVLFFICVVSVMSFDNFRRLINNYSN